MQIPFTQAVHHIDSSAWRVLPKPCGARQDFGHRNIGADPAAIAQVWTARVITKQLAGRTEIRCGERQQSMLTGL